MEDDAMKFEKYINGGWAIYDDDNLLICIAMYKRGALEVIRRLECKPTEQATVQLGIIEEEIKMLSQELRQANKRLQRLKKCCAE
jgi:hypothetical protein